jgi:dihydrofolate reductase
MERSSRVGKLLWHTMMSLDGFIAGRNDDMSWAFGMDAGSGETVDKVVSSTGALLVGRRTQDVEDRIQPGFYGGAFRGPFFVLRHDPPPEPPVVKGVTGRFLDVGIEDAVTIAKEAADGGDVVVLGANIARQCLEAELLDEVIVHVAPVLGRRRRPPVRPRRRRASQARANLVGRRGRNDRAPLLDRTRIVLLTTLSRAAPGQRLGGSAGTVAVATRHIR